jgi:hypothetical protein
VNPGRFNLDGVLGVVADDGDGPAVSGLEMGVGVVGGDQLDPVSDGKRHNEAPLAARC